ncbi:unnamed protein product [Symbiodinium natans]|uniref:Uncharacterized protein n=1 Tax=Symbiodinium natans TaxID=878477 RepID=A0A812TMV4_9DINO|nr:unnamed protein product [Symbiodinium natans]
MLSPARISAGSPDPCMQIMQTMPGTSLLETAAASHQQTSSRDAPWRCSDTAPQAVCAADINNAADTLSALSGFQHRQLATSAITADVQNVRSPAAPGCRITRTVSSSQAS